LQYDDTLKRLEGPDGKGAGGGGGLYVKPAGVYEITSARTRFIPANNTRPLLLGIAIGLLIKACFNSKRKK